MYRLGIRSKHFSFCSAFFILAACPPSLRIMPSALQAASERSLDNVAGLASAKDKRHPYTSAHIRTCAQKKGEQERHFRRRNNKQPAKSSILQIVVNRLVALAHFRPVLRANDTHEHVSPPRSPLPPSVERYDTRFSNPVMAKL